MPTLQGLPAQAGLAGSLQQLSSSKLCWFLIVQASEAVCGTPAGPARAGKVGELSCAGGFYRGEVLAGQPHGKGQFFTMLVRWSVTVARCSSETL